MANFKTGWHGPSLVQNDNSDLKGNFSGIDRVPWKENTSSSSNSVKLTAAVEGTDNATAYDVDIASFAITDDLEGTDSTDYLRCTNFNFNIPPHATIRGVKVRFKCQSTGDDALETHDGRIYLVVDGSYINGDDGRDHTSTSWPEDSVEGNGLAWEVRGGDESSNDETLWGYTTSQLTPAKVNSSSFGIVLAAQLNNSSSLDTAHPCIEHVRLKVWYDIGDWGSNGKALSSPLLSTWNGSKDYLIVDSRWDTSDTEDNTLNGGVTEKKFDEDQDRHYWCADHSSLNIEDKSFAFSVWINAYDSVTGTHPIISKTWYNASYGIPHYWDYCFQLEGNPGEIRVHVPNQANPYAGTPYQFLTNKSIVTAADTWYHLAFSYNDTTKEMKVYKNGTIAQTFSFPLGTYHHTNASFAIGGKHSIAPDFTAATDFANLRIGLVGYWRADQGEAISDSDVLFLYNNGVGRFYETLPADIKTNLISYWHLSEASGNAADSHGSNTLTDENPHTTAEDDFEPARQKSYKLKSTLLTPSIHLGDSGNFDDAATGRS